MGLTDFQKHHNLIKKKVCNDKEDSPIIYILLNERGLGSDSCLCYQGLGSAIMDEYQKTRQPYG